MDKAKHIIAGAIVGLLGAAILVGSPFLGATVFSIVFGGLKEYADTKGPWGMPITGWNWADLFATVLGGVAAGILCVLVPSIPEYLATTKTLF